MWMAGVFNSMLTQGHVSINRFLSTTRSYLSLLRAAGQRIFVELPDGYALLDVPSAYEMTPNGCRWIYKHADGLIAVRSWASIARQALYLCVDILAGAPCRLLLSHHIALNGDDGADAVPVQFERDTGGIVIRPDLSPISDAVSPPGASASIRAGVLSSSTWVGTSCCLSMGDRGSSPISRSLLRRQRQ
jgi:hypothetical protein